MPGRGGAGAIACPSLAFSKALSELVRRGLSFQSPTKTVNGLLVFDLPFDSPKVTNKKLIELVELIG